MRNHVIASMALVSILLAQVSTGAQAQTLAPEFATDYNLTDLGTVPGVPPNFGGLFILSSDPDALYIGGNADTATGGLYRIELVRDGSNLITGFTGTAVQVAPAPYNDGGIVPDPGGLISFAQYPANRYGQIDLDTGTVVTDIDLSSLGVAATSTSVAFIPAGLPDAGGMRIGSWSGGQFYDVDYSIGAGGLITINGVTNIPGSTLPGGPTGWTYVQAGSPQIMVASMVVSEYSTGQVAVFEMDAGGNPIIATRRLFISGLSGALGAAIDPVSGAFLFSTFGGGDRVIAVNGFVAPPVATGNLTPADLNFGTSPIGNPSTSHVLTLTSTGEAPLVIGSATLNGDYYTATSTCPIGTPGLAPGANCTIEVTCSPAAAGSQSGSYVISTNAGTFTSGLQCSGASAGPAPRLVPTLSTWTLGGLMSLLLCMGWLAYRHRAQA